MERGEEKEARVKNAKNTQREHGSAEARRRTGNGAEKGIHHEECKNAQTKHCSAEARRRHGKGEEKGSQGDAIKKWPTRRRQNRGLHQKWIERRKKHP